MFNLNLLICSKYFNNNVSFLPYIDNRVSPLQKAGYNDDFIFEFFNDKPHLEDLCLGVLLTV